MTTKNVRKEDIIRILKDEICENCGNLDFISGKQVCLDANVPGHQLVIEMNTCGRFKKKQAPWVLSDEQVENYRRINWEMKKAKEAAAKMKAYEEEYAESSKRLS